MTSEIANFLNEVIQPRGVAVLVEGAHMCSMMRGVKQSEASMSTSAYLGEFRTDRQLKDDFLKQIALRRTNN
jgi:GTP cyclohydrolase I